MLIKWSKFFTEQNSMMIFFYPNLLCIINDECVIKIILCFKEILEVFHKWLTASHWHFSCICANSIWTEKCFIWIKILKDCLSIADMSASVHKDIANFTHISQKFINSRSFNDVHFMSLLSNCILIRGSLECYWYLKCSILLY